MDTKGVTVQATWDGRWEARRGSSSFETRGHGCWQVKQRDAMSGHGRIGETSKEAYTLSDKPRLGVVRRTKKTVTFSF